MNRWNKVLALASIAALCLSANSLLAQGGNNGGGNNGGGGGRRNNGGFGNMDPAARRQAQIDQYKDRFEITDDSEWNAIAPAIGKVIDAQQEARAAAFGGFGRGGRGAGGPGGAATDTTGNNQGGGRRQRNPGGPGGGTPSPEMQALQAALDAKASPDEIKAKLERVRAAAKDKEAKLTAAQSDLVKLLTARQEATGVLYGLLK